MDANSIKNMAMSRRGVMAAAAAAGVGLVTEEVRTAANAATAPVKALAAAASDITIKSIETFDFVVPQPAPRGPVVQQFGGGTPGRMNVVRIETNSGVKGYSFNGLSPDALPAAQALLVGQSLFTIEQYLKKGLLDWPGLEEAMWDAIGRIAGQPVSKLLGGAKIPTMPVYITYVWPGDAAQESVTPKQQAEQAKLVKAAGFKAMKIRCFRKDTNVDAEAVAEILAVGGPGFRCMVDRTATQPGLWTFEQAVAGAKALEKAGCHWLEEPLARDDYIGPAKLQKETGMLIVGGEGYRGLDPYKLCLLNGTYEILQPEIRTVAGVLMLRKVGVLCEAWGLPIAPHASSGLGLAGKLQVSAAMGSYIQEIGVLTPPNLPDDQCTPFLPILHGVQPYKFQNGEMIVPMNPGLGLNVDDAALNKFRVEGFERRQGGGGRQGQGQGQQGQGQGGRQGAGQPPARQ